MRILGRNRPFSALISNMGQAPQHTLKSFGTWPRFPVIFPFHQSPDPALNRVTRPESVPYSKSFLENMGS